MSEQDVIPTRRSMDQTSVGVAGFPSTWQPSSVDSVANKILKSSLFCVQRYEKWVLN